MEIRKPEKQKTETQFSQKDIDLYKRRIYRTVDDCGTGEY
jgi:hypothetical protein